MRRLTLLGVLMVAAAVLPMAGWWRAEPPAVAQAPPKAPVSPAPKFSPKAKDQPKPAQGLKISFVPTPNDALRLALTDCRALPEEVRPYVRYVWVEDGKTTSLQATSFTTNVWSRATTVYQVPDVFDGKKLVLARIDLRRFAPRDKDLREVASTWEELRFEPRFNLLLTPGTLKAAAATFGDMEFRGIWVKWGVVGKGFGADWQLTRHAGKFRLKDLTDCVLAAIPDPSLDQEAYFELAELTGSYAALVTHPYYISRALSAIKDDGLYAVLYGGLYYDLAGIGAKFKKGTDLDNLLESIGVGNVVQGITSEQVFEKLRSDMRAVMFRSAVTGNKRMAEVFPILQGRPDQSQRICSITHDVKRKRIDVDTHAAMNLIKFKDDGREVIFDRPNGFHGYGAYNGQGKRVEKVPDDIASDHTVPSPHHTELQGAISCIRCHEAEGSDGWKSLRNDVKTLTMNGLNIFGDVTRRDQFDTIDRLVGLYHGNIEKPLQQGRDAYAAAVLRATGPWKESKRAQADVIQLAAKKVADIYKEHTYDLWDAKRALRALGVVVEHPDPDELNKEAKKLFARLVPPEIRAGVAVPLVGAVIIPEDARIAAVRDNIGADYADFALTHAFITYRARERLPELIKKEEAKK